MEEEHLARPWKKLADPLRAYPPRAAYIGFGELPGTVTSRRAIEFISPLFKEEEKEIIIPPYASQLFARIDELNNKIEGLSKMLTEMRSEMSLLEPKFEQKIVLIRSIPREQAKEEILKLFRTTERPLYYHEIAEKLQLDLEQVVDIVDELESEGLIGDVE